MPFGFPNLQFQPLSGLTFPWAAKEAPGMPSMDAGLGPDGIGLGMQMLIAWADLNTACVEILGYSWRDHTVDQNLSGDIAFISPGPPMTVTTTQPHGLRDGEQVTITGVDDAGCSNANGTWIITVLDNTRFEINGVCDTSYLTGGAWSCTRNGSSILRRRLPWQHPFWNQLYAHKITKVQGLRQTGKAFLPFNLDGSPLGNVGLGYHTNYGPYTSYDLAVLTIAFWRPPYYVRTDADILDEDGNPQEYLRYVDKHWQSEAQMLSRESGAFTWSPNQGFSVLGVEIGPSAGGAPVPGSVGQVVAHEKVSRRWYELPEAGVFEILEMTGTPDGLAKNLIYTQTPTNNPVTAFVYTAGNPIKGCVNGPIGGGFEDFIGEDDFRFFGCYSGTLRLDGVEIVPRPLHLPPFLMQIPVLSHNEALSQQQYDVVFHFDLFDPPRNPLIQGRRGYRGHNLLPWAGDGLWYMVQAPSIVPGAGTTTTQLQYADFTDLFKIL